MPSMECYKEAIVKNRKLFFFAREKLLRRKNFLGKFRSVGTREILARLADQATLRAAGKIFSERFSRIFCGPRALAPSRNRAGQVARMRSRETSLDVRRFSDGLQQRPCRGHGFNEINRL